MTSAARSSGLNKKAVDDFYDLLDDLMTQFQFQPSQIYNVDETSITCNPKTAKTLIACKGKKQVGSRSSAERGETVTAEICFSASGQFMPPMLIFPRKKENPEYLVGAPLGAWAEFHESGWIQAHIFTKWFKTFIKFSKSSKTTPTLLLLDGHSTHVKNSELIDLAQENGVNILCFPPHCTHRLQPLDVAFMKPLSNFYTEQVSIWMRDNFHRVLQLKHIYEVFGKAFMKAAKMETAVNAFKKTGISPFNRNVFSKDDFVQLVANDNAILHSDNLEGI